MFVTTRKVGADVLTFVCLCDRDDNYGYPGSNYVQKKHIHSLVRLLSVEKTIVSALAIRTQI